METVFGLAYKRMLDCTIAQELKKENEYFSDKFDERLYVDLRPSHCYTDELEKPTRNDSKMTIIIETKTPLVKKVRLRVWGTQANNIFIYNTTVH